MNNPTMWIPMTSSKSKGATRTKTHIRETQRPRQPLVASVPVATILMIKATTLPYYADWSTVSAIRPHPTSWLLALSVCTNSSLCGLGNTNWLSARLVY